MELQSKSAFARRIEVSPARISQMIGLGIIGPDALEGQGPHAQIRVEVALAQIAARRHPGQALGNGLKTKVVESAPPPPATPGAAAPPVDSSLAQQLQELRVERETRLNRIAARDEALAMGQLMHADQVRAEIGRLLQTLEDKNAGMLADFANAVASAFGVNQRDVLHLLRQVRAEKRKEVAAALAAEAEAAPETVEVEIGELV